MRTGELNSSNTKLGANCTWPL